MEDEIAKLVVVAFNKLPDKSKPALDHDHGVRYWVPLSGIVLEHADSRLECVALATGMKCLPASKLSNAKGQILHDWHAETLTLRAFNHFLLRECLEILNADTTQSLYLQRRDNNDISRTSVKQPFTINPSLKIHMYCSEAPCGDASMEVIMRAQADPTPWVKELEKSSSCADGALLKGRGNFSELGIVRRKPARADSPPTLSKSCSDKLASKQCTSVLSSTTSLLISPENAYLSDLILPRSEHVPAACERAFGASGRMRPVVNMRWDGGYGFRPFQVHSTDHEFMYSRRQKHVAQLKPSNISTFWNPYARETLIGGVLQGRRQGDTRAASVLSRARMWALTATTCTKLLALSAVLQFNQYEEFKEFSGLLVERKRVKEEIQAEALNGWVRNMRDDFNLSEAVQDYETKA